MNISELFSSYITYLVHPFKSHQALIDGYSNEMSYVPRKLSIYEALSASWAFVVINGILRILLLNFILLAFVKVSDSTGGLLSQLTSQNEFSGFYFLVLSTILDVIFYPLLTLILIQFWEITIKIYGRLLHQEDSEQIDEKAKTIMSVTLSSHILLIVPIIGGMAQSLASMILLYAGLRKQLKASPVLCACIMITPLLFAFFMFSVFAILLMLIIL